MFVCILCVGEVVRMSFCVYGHTHLRVCVHLDEGAQCNLDNVINRVGQMLNNLVIYALTGGL